MSVRNLRRSNRLRSTVTACAGMLGVVGLATLPAVSLLAAESDGGRRIEEVVVTAERRESTVQDTAISITAFNSEFIEEFGLRNQEDLQNYVPATQIQPYDVTIRGIGRLFRTLGGDPGVSTYLNGVYSEDFGIASTEGGLYDIERIEVLRGPQGTLYGRNGVGGAINFINSKPGPEFGGEIRIIGGDYGMFETYGLVEGPIIEDLLNGKFVGSKRRRDGYIDDIGPFESSINNYGDENYAVAFTLTPTDTISSNVRVNERSYRRKFNGGAGSVPIVTSQHGGPDRFTESIAFGYTLLSQGNGACPTNLPSGQFCFAHPNANVHRIARRVRPGIERTGGITAANDTGDGAGPGLNFNVLDPAAVNNARGGVGSNAVGINYGYHAPVDRLSPVQDRTDLDTDSLEVSTHGQYDEFFDHQAMAFDTSWDITDGVTVKYIAGYTDYFYDRTTDEDKTSNTLIGSYDFYVLQENENWQHEIQLFLDFDDLTITSGAFIYDAHIDQRLDLYDPIDTQGRFQDAANYGTAELTGFLNAILPGTVTIDSAKALFDAGATPGADGTVTHFGVWSGDRGTALRSGAVTDGTFFAWDNIQDTRAKAIYTQAEWNFAEQWALTVGFRYANDDKKGQEKIFVYLEDAFFDGLILNGLDLDAEEPGLEIPVPAACVGQGFTALQCLNVATGALNADSSVPSDADLPNRAPLRLGGAPAAFSSYLPLDHSWDDITWRFNLDYEPTDDILLYFSTTKGWRSGGFNLGFRSVQNPIYSEERVTSFEVGFKGQLMDGTLQLNTSAYYYDYENIQQLSTINNPIFGVGAAAVNAPEARTIGFEGEILWLPSENLTLGGNWSYTNAEFADTFETIETTNPDLPGSIFSPQERVFDADGNRLTNIPEWKFVVYGDYVVPLGANGSLDILSSVSWTDEFFFSYDNSEFDSAPDVWRWDASATWTSPSEKLLIRAFINNITDELGIREYSAFGELSGGFLRGGTTNDPRTYGAELRWKFGAL